MNYFLLLLIVPALTFAQTKKKGQGFAPLESSMVPCLKGIGYDPREILVWKGDAKDKANFVKAVNKMDLHTEADLKTLNHCKKYAHKELTAAEASAVEAKLSGNK